MRAPNRIQLAIGGEIVEVTMSEQQARDYTDGKPITFTADDGQCITPCPVGGRHRTVAAQLATVLR